MNPQVDYQSVNRALWNSKTAAHTQSDFYNMDAFLAGANSLKEIELDLLGDVRGKSILHLQCHFGQDTLSLARMGANVTGVDLSPDAIAKAKDLNTQLGLNAKFIAADIYDLPGLLQQEFDIVFTSYGTIIWLPDMNKWAGLIQHFLKPGGSLIFVDFHPFSLMYDDDYNGILYSYFNTGMIIETEAGTYADRTADIHLASNTWNHSLSETFQAIIDTGLQIITFREFDYSPYNLSKNMKEVAPGRYQAIGMDGKIPHLLALVAKKPD